MSSDRSGWETGRVVPGLDGLAPAADPRTVSWQWSGLGTLRARLGRYSGPVQLALADSEVTVTAPVFGRIFGVRTFSCRPGPDVVAYPVKGTFFWTCIGLAQSDDHDVAFRVGDQVTVLRTFAAAGFTVSPRERKIRYS